MAKSDTENDVRNSLIKSFFPASDSQLEVKIDNYKIDMIVYLNPLSASGKKRPFKTPLFFIETKKNLTDKDDHFVQLLITINKNNVLGKIPAPKYLAVSDNDQFYYIDFIQVRHLLYANVDWRTTPSNYSSPKFKKIKAICLNDPAFSGGLKCIPLKSTPLYKGPSLPEIINKSKLLYREDGKLTITEDFFIDVYKQWEKTVLPTIDISPNERDLIPDFFFAELSDKKDLTVYKDNDKFIVKLNSEGFEFNQSFDYKDNQKESKGFWNFYEKPSEEEFNKIITRRDLLLSDEKRGRSGAFYTPTIWVQKSQEYLESYLGKNWQDEYYIWDCCTGTGNMLKGLTNSDKIFASTLDSPDVEILKNSPAKGINLKTENIFQFDFLNDEFDKCPQELQDIINDPEKRKKLVIYINPPYVTSVDYKCHTTRGKSTKSKVHITNTYYKYIKEIGPSIQELSIQFLHRIYKEIPSCIIGEFSKLKIIQSKESKELLKVFTPKLEKCFVVSSKTFDNVESPFPIGFKIWDCGKKEIFKEIEVDILDEKGDFLGVKKVKPSKDDSLITWNHIKGVDGNILGYIHVKPDDLASSTMVCISQKPPINKKGKFVKATPKGYIRKICQDNLVPCSIYLAVRRCIDLTWLNSKDYYQIPNDSWKSDKEFQADCLVYTIFSDNNHTLSVNGEYSWIPFTEEELEYKIENPFMSNYLEGKVIPSSGMSSIKGYNFHVTKKNFSKESWDLYNSALELWKYYKNYKGLENIKNPNVSLYEIRAFFQGINQNPENNVKSLGSFSKSDSKYQKLREDMKEKIVILSEKISNKVYEHGFLIGTYDRKILEKNKKENLGFPLKPKN